MTDTQPADSDTETSLRQHAEDVLDDADDPDITVDDLEGQLNDLVNEYGIPVSEAKRSVRQKNDIPVPDNDPSSGDDPLVDIVDVNRGAYDNETWVEVEVKIVDLWEPRSENVAQTGLCGDETDTTRFTKWERSDLDELEEGSVYRLSPVKVHEYQGDFSIDLNSNTVIEELDRDITVDDAGLELTAPLVAFQNGSGLIKRCPNDDCTRVVQNGRCKDHGKVEGEFDLRIKGVMDTGTETQAVLFDADQTTELTGITLEEAEEMARESMDTEVVGDRMEDQLLGRYFTVSGGVMGEYLLVDDFSDIGEDHTERAREFLQTVRGETA